MECPDLRKLQSRHKGQNRIDHAVNSIGGDVVNRILGYSLYLFGFPYEFISSKTGLSEAGFKTLARQINKNGIGRFQDRRRKKECSYLKGRGKNINDATIVNYNEQDNIHAEFEIKGSVSIKIRKDDILGKKLLTLLLMEAGVLMQKDATQILNCQRLTVRKNLLKLQSSGAKGLIDRRRGQTKDYKFDAKVIFEIIKKFISGVFDMETPSKTNTNKHLNEKFSQSFSERATALHLKKMGLTDHKKELITEIVRQTNERIDLLEYLEFEDKRIGAKSERHIEMLRKFKDGFGCCFNEKMETNFFQVEKRVEAFQAELQVLILESILAKIEGEFSQCPNCCSNNVVFYKRNNTSERKKRYPIKTSLGSILFLEPRLLRKGRCNSCKSEFDIAKDILKLSENNKFTPLTQKKICSANRAGSYLNAVRNLNELTNIDLNRNQVRMISIHVGEFIKNEFDELYKEIEEQPPEIIIQRHPLVEELRIDERYLDASRYLIVLAVDGGRMQMFDWVPPKKKMRWVENRVFRISIYDKKNLCDLSCEMDDIGQAKVYKSARILPDLTTYGATNRNWEETGPLIISHLHMRGIKPEEVEVCISDGSSHIMQKIFLPLFPQSVHILDYYHKNEALHKCLKTNNAMEEFQRLKKLLWEGEINEIIKELKSLQFKVGKPAEGKKRKNDDSRVILDNYINHLGENKQRLQYKKFRNWKYPIGSGSIESAVKLFGKRIKGTEKQWSEEGGESILHLYAFLLSEDERWKKLWEVQTPWI